MMWKPDIHVLPINDLREHEESRNCWCEPALHREGDTVIVTHRSADGPELVKQQ